MTWDYPFVAGLMQLADDVRGIFDAAGLAKDAAGLHNLISYSGDWSDWMGVQHPGENGQWPHLDQLYAHTNIDLVCFDDYLPLSDWTTGGGGLDALYWNAPVPASWPPSATDMNGLGLSGSPTLYSLDYLKANIEGGEKFNWYYGDGANAGMGLDPNGTDLRVSLPAGDRLAQAAVPIPPISNCWRTSNYAGGGTIRIRRSTMRATAMAGRRMGRRRNGFRNRNPSLSPNMESRGGSRHQSAERLLQSRRRGQRNTLLVNLGPERRGRICAAPRRRNPIARAASHLRILGNGWP